METILISLIRMFKLGPEVSLKGSPTVSPTTVALWDLEEENERLKKIIARQALELEVKSELLKKTSFQIKTRR